MANLTQTSIIVKKSTVEELTESVNKYRDKGWEFSGPPFSHDGWVCQQLTRP
jgi:hypothetical protein